MREEDAKFKFEKQLPAPDKIEKGKKKKYSSKKPWKISSEWKAGSIFTHSSVTISNGKVVSKTEESLTIEEIMKQKEENKLDKFKFYKAFWLPFSYSNKYKTRKDALTAWENYIKKEKVDERAIYKLTNIETGEEEILNGEI